MRILLFVFSVLFFSLEGNAQILNVQKSELKKDTSNFIGSMTASVDLYNRSVAADKKMSFFEAKFKSGFAWFIKNSTLTFINDFSFAELNKEMIKSVGFQHVRYSLFESGEFHPEAFAQYQFDNYRGLAPRWLGGVGLRHDLIQAKTFNFFYGVGVMYEYEVWQEIEKPDKVYKSLIKSTNYIGFHWDATEDFNLHMISYFQTAPDKKDNLWRKRYSFEISMNTAISSRFSINNSFSISHESQPIIDVVPTIYNLEMGINYFIR